MRIQALPLCFLACVLAACSGQAPVPPSAAPEAAPPSPPRPVGGDRDAHGCIPSAGYAWCNATKQCERPWELAQAKGFELSGKGFDAYCGNDAKQ